MCKKQDKQQQPVEVTCPCYLTNLPIGKDCYEGKSQEKLADALAMHICETDGGETPVFARQIGLESKWAAVSQDLQRRSILELLTKYLIVEKKLTGMATMRVMNPEGENKVMEIPCTWEDKLESLLFRKSYDRYVVRKVKQVEEKELECEGLTLDRTALCKS